MGDDGAVIVTGASRGIGGAVAQLIGSRGAPVVVNYASARHAAERTVAAIQACGGEALAVCADVRQESEIVRLFDAAVSEFGRISGLVNNAGVTGGFSRVEDVTAESIEEVLKVNVGGMILCCREAVKHMSILRGGKGGSIVNISSLVARTGGGGEWVHYAASKGAVNSFTIGMAREVAEEGIRVNAVAPGLIDTELHSANGRPDRLRRMAPTIRMKRAGTTEEVAEAVAWLLSDAASYTTGTVLEVGGGR